MRNNCNVCGSKLNNCTCGIRSNNNPNNYPCGIRSNNISLPPKWRVLSTPVIAPRVTRTVSNASNREYCNVCGSNVNNCTCKMKTRCNSGRNANNCNICGRKRNNCPCEIINRHSKKAPTKAKKPNKKKNTTKK